MLLLKADSDIKGRLEDSYTDQMRIDKAKPFHCQTSKGKTELLKT